MELRHEQDGRVRTSRVVCPTAVLPGRCSCCATYAKTASVWSSGWTFWTTAGQSYELLENAGEAGMVPDFAGKIWNFVPYAGFKLQILLQITQLTHGCGEFIL